MAPNPTITFRRITVDDIPDFVRLRRLMFELMGDDPPESMNASDLASRLYFQKVIPKDLFFGWVAETPKNRLIGAGGAVIDQHPPSPSNLSGQIAYLMNVVVEPAYQSQGIGRALMEHMIAWLKEKGIVIVSLHASDQGRPLYESMGFEATTEMRKKIFTYNPPSDS